MATLNQSHQHRHLLLTQQSPQANERSYRTTVERIPTEIPHANVNNEYLSTRKKRRSTYTCDESSEGEDDVLLDSQRVARHSSYHTFSLNNNAMGPEILGGSSQDYMSFHNLKERQLSL